MTSPEHWVKLGEEATKSLEGYLDPFTTMGLISVGIGVFLEEVILMPRQWADRYYNLKHWSVMKSGGHFAPMEEPEALVDDIRAFHRPLRLY